MYVHANSRFLFAVFIYVVLSVIFTGFLVYAIISIKLIPFIMALGFLGLNQCLIGHYFTNYRLIIPKIGGKVYYSRGVLIKKEDYEES